VVTAAAAANSGTSRSGPPLGPDHTEVTMNRTRRIRRLAGALAGLAGALLAFAAAAPAAFASVHPGPVPSIREKHPPMPLGHIFGPVVKVPGHTVVTGGMPGWQVALIAAGAALLAAVLALIADRAWAARRRQMAGVG
jgi:hypothetical protein